jgi:glycosyltransferase involved in cell wall biosynthesis
VRIYSPEPGVEPGRTERGRVHALPFDGLAARAARLLAREDVDVPAHLFQEVRRLLYSEQLRHKLGTSLAAYGPDAIYERYTLFGYAGVEIARELGVPLLLEVNAPLAAEGARRRGWVLHRSAAAMEAEILRRADAVLAVSEAVGEHARSLGVEPERIELLPNGVDPARFDASISGEAARREHGLEEKIVIGYVGSLRAWHDLDTLLEALRHLVQSGVPAHLLAVGGGPRAEELERRGAGHATFPGAVEHERVPELIAAMDVAVVPFGGDERYFSPLKLFEYMAMGKPIVGARMGQVTELLVPGETGLVYEPGDAADLARRIREILDRPDRGAALGAAARRRVLAEHTWEARAGRIVELCDSFRRRAAVG